MTGPRSSVLGEVPKRAGKLAGHQRVLAPVGVTPVPNVRGRLGLWTPDADLLDAIQGAAA